MGWVWCDWVVVKTKLLSARDLQSGEREKSRTKGKSVLYCKGTSLGLAARQRERTKVVPIREQGREPKLRGEEEEE